MFETLGLQQIGKHFFCGLIVKKQTVFPRETCNTKEGEAFRKTQYKGKMFFSHGTNHSCGVLVLVKGDLEFELKSSIVDTDGRWILMDATVQGSDFLFANIYAPNRVQGQCTFFRSLGRDIGTLRYTC